MNYIKLGQNIRTARIEKGYTQAQMAEIMGYSVQHVSHVENGTTKMSTEFLISLADCLEISLDELFRGSLSYDLKEYERYNINSLLNNSAPEERKMLIKTLTLVKSIIEDLIDSAES